MELASKHGKLFGTDGIRGAYGRFPITESVAYALGQTLAGRKPLLTCYDSRFSSASLERALHQGVRDGGGEAISYGMAPTPALAYMVAREDVGGGVVISASHNPYTDNGFKVFNAKGRKLSSAEETSLTQEIYRYYREQSQSHFGTMDIEARREPSAYLDVLKACLQDVPVPLKPMKIIIDCAHGASSLMARELFLGTQQPNMQFELIHSSPNGRNINHGVGAIAPAALCARVKEAGAFLGLAFDGDGDRLLLVDHQAKEVSGSSLLAVMALWLHEQGKLEGGVVATTELANSGLDRFLADHNIGVLRSAVGDKELAAVMESHGAVLAGEPSGHFLFADHLYSGDSLHSAIKILALTMGRLAVDPDFQWSDAAAGIPLLAEQMLSGAVEEKVPLEQLPSVQQAVETAEQKLASGRVLWRYSGTENKLRILVEGSDQVEVDRTAESLMHHSLGAIQRGPKKLRCYHKHYDTMPRLDDNSQGRKL